MNVLNQIGLGKLGAAAPGEEDQRVLDLFRNRAELKKAYSELQDEIHRLKERLRQQEGATNRVQEILAGLEARLENRELGYSTMVFYLLRRLWRAGHDVLAAYAADLERQHVERERRAFVVDLNRQQFARRQQCEAAAAAAQAALVDARQLLRNAEQKLEQLNRPWHRFQRKEHESRVPPLRAAIVAAEAALTAAREQQQRLAHEADQGFPGLSVGARRAINVELIACAEVLCLRLIKSPLLQLARNAAMNREVTEEYGSRDECEALMADIERAQAVLEQNTDLTQQVNARAARLSRSVRYTTVEDTVPAFDSLLPVRSDADPLLQALERPARERRSAQAPEPQPPNVLAEDSWDLFHALIR